MCLSFSTSVLTFLLGTFFNAYNVAKFRTVSPAIGAVSIAWQWVLVMQVFDAMAWKSSDRRPIMNRFAARGAFIANITQPLVVGLSLLYFMSNKPPASTALATGVLLAYAAWAAYSVVKLWPSVTSLYMQEDCGHLVYDWWNKLPRGGLIYLATLISVLALLLRPATFAGVQIGYILVTLAVSSAIYPCGVASMWCWFAAFAPLLVTALASNPRNAKWAFSK